MSSHFYSMLYRMKYIERWGLMRSTERENLCEHSLFTAIIAHALCVIKNRRLGGNIDPNRAAVAAMFHDTPEILTGDLPTPIKYYSGELRDAYKKIESEAGRRLCELLPEDLKADFLPLYREDDKEISAIVKAADKISALIKCVRETAAGNAEFSRARESINTAIKELSLPEADIFINEFLESFTLPLDDITLDRADG